MIGAVSSVGDEVCCSTIIFARQVAGLVAAGWRIFLLWMLVYCRAESLVWSAIPRELGNVHFRFAITATYRWSLALPVQIRTRQCKG